MDPAFPFFRVKSGKNLPGSRFSSPSSSWFKEHSSDVNKVIVFYQQARERLEGEIPAGWGEEMGIFSLWETNSRFLEGILI